MPVKLADLTLEGPLERPQVSSRYDSVRLLVRRRGTPLGYVEVANDEDALTGRALAAAVVERLAAPAWASLAAEGLAAEPAAPPAPGAISVVVCTRGRPRELAGCLEALARQTHAPAEVLVVDNAPADGVTRDVATAFGVRYVAEPRPGLDWARNRGLQAAAGTIVAYTDDDARADPGWLAAVAAGFCAPDVQCVTGLVLPAELETRAQTLFEDVYGGMGKGFVARLHTRRGRPMVYRAQALGVGANMAFRREALVRVGGFDPALDTGTATGGAGDLDALQRVLETDAVIAYRPDAIVRHRHRRTMRALRRQLFDNGRGYTAYLLNAFRRARGADRLRVVYWAGLWLWWAHARRIVRRLLRRERLPLPLILAETAGALAGPLLYVVAQRRARALARSGGR